MKNYLSLIKTYTHYELKVTLISVIIEFYSYDFFVVKQCSLIEYVTIVETVVLCLKYNVVLFVKHLDAIQYEI